MTDREALYRPILENPACDTARLVYADWLEENAGTVPCPICTGPGFNRGPFNDGCVKCRGSFTVSDGNAGRANFIRRAVDAGEVENGWYLQPHIHHNFKAAFKVAGLRDEQYFYRRGFVSSVRTTLADWVGGECPRCHGRGGWETGPHSEDCRHCDATGRTPALGPRIVAEQPVQEVKVTDAEWVTRAGILSSYVRLPNVGRSVVDPKILVMHPDEASARKMLSDWLLNWARREAGLPPILSGGNDDQDSGS